MDRSEAWIEQTVLSYLKVHPQAMDTIDGIADWWFRHHGAVDRRALALVLRALVRRGILEQIGGGRDGLYRGVRILSDSLDERRRPRQCIRGLKMDLP